MSTMLKPSKPLAIGLGIAGVVIFCITSLMIRNAGMSAAATGEGQALRGYGNIAIHVTGLVLFGVATGYLFRAKMRVFACLTGIVVVGTALLSMKNLVDFAAIEQTSVTRAREAQVNAQDEWRKANLDAQKKKQENVVKMTEGQLSWLKNTTRNADGRRERKDSMEQASKLITEYAKADIPVTEAPKTGEIIIRPDGGTELISKATGMDKEFIELLGNLYQNFMLIMMESIIWPLAAFFYPPKGYKAEMEALAVAVPLTPIAEPVRKLLAAPKKEKPITVRTEPTDEWRVLLDEIDYPPAGSRHKGPPRPKDKREHVAPRFYVFLQSYSETGEITTDEITSIYEDFNGIDHRIAWGERIVKSELEGLGRKFVTKNMGKSPTCYTIVPQTPEKVRALLEKRGVLTTQTRKTGAGESSILEVASEPDDPDKKIAWPSIWRKQATGPVH